MTACKNEQCYESCDFMLNGRASALCYCCHTAYKMGVQAAIDELRKYPLNRHAREFALELERTVLKGETG